MTITSRDTVSGAQGLQESSHYGRRQILTVDKRLINDGNCDFNEKSPAYERVITSYVRESWCGRGGGGWAIAGMQSGRRSRQAVPNGKMGA